MKIETTEIKPEVIDMEKQADGSYVMVEEVEVLDVDALIAELEGSVVTKTETVDAFLDRQDDDRDEWSRITNDLYPEQYASGPVKSHVHRSTDRIQSYLAKERQERDPE